MKVKYDDLVAYLEASKDWLLAHDNPKFRTFIGPKAADDVPIRIILPTTNDDLSSAVYVVTAVATLAKFAGIPAHEMADCITPTSVQALLDAIKHFDTEPGVFKVQLTAASHLAGYDAYLDFRHSPNREHGGLAAHADTPEKALTSLLATLKDKWGPCPACGHPLAGKPLREATS